MPATPHCGSIASDIAQPPPILSVPVPGVEGLAHLQQLAEEHLKQPISGPPRGHLH